MLTNLLFMLRLLRNLGDLFTRVQDPVSHWLAILHLLGNWICRSGAHSSLGRDPQPYGRPEKLLTAKIAGVF
jgi:hypothetical protein